MARTPKPHPGASGAAIGDSSGDVISNPITDNAIDPASLGTGGGGFDADDDSGTDYQRDASGSIKRNLDGSPRKKRGRKPGSTGKTQTRVRDLKASIDSLTSMLGVFHMGIAAATSAPEMMLTEDEARDLATAAVPVLDQFDWMPDPRYAAIGGFLIVAGKIYIPRAVAISQRAKKTVRKPAPIVQPSAPVQTQSQNGFADFGDVTRAN